MMGIGPCLHGLTIDPVWEGAILKIAQQFI